MIARVKASKSRGRATGKSRGRATGMSVTARWPSTGTGPAPMAALREDLDRRGLLEEMLVVWGDEFGFKGFENRVSVNDIHATILHLIGLDHTRLTHRFNGRDFRLTDVSGDVVRRIVA